jgi:hypothetical protein
VTLGTYAGSVMQIIMNTIQSVIVSPHWINLNTDYILIN